MGFSYSQTENFEMEKLSSDTGYLKKQWRSTGGLTPYVFLLSYALSTPWIEIKEIKERGLTDKPSNSFLLGFRYNITPLCSSTMSIFSALDSLLILNSLWNPSSPSYPEFPQFIRNWNPQWVENSQWALMEKRGDLNTSFTLWAVIAHVAAHQNNTQNLTLNFLVALA